MSETCLLLSSSLLVVVVACGKDNSNFCLGANPNNNCAEIDADSGCTSSDQCAAPIAVCDVTGTKMCVECVADQASACTGTEPICGDDHACRGCAAHNECPASNTCLPDGSCAATETVAYVDPTGTGNACTKAMPCGTLALGLAKNLPHVKITGTLNEANTTTINRAVTILAEPGATINVVADDVPVVSVATSGADVQVFDLEITGATQAGGVGIDLPTGGTPKLTLTRVKVDSNQGGGISSSGGSLTVSQSTLSGNQGGGISVSGVGATFDLSNSFVVGNGNADMVAGSEFGGLSLTAGAGSHRLEFNTIVYNHAKQGTLLAAGVACSVTGFNAPRNIITSNNEGTTFPAQTKGSCSYGNSYTQPDSAANTLQFASLTSNPPDLHLTAASPGSVTDAAGACTGKDIDGEARPIGGACDLGADELKP